MRISISLERQFEEWLTTPESTSFMQKQLDLYINNTFEKKDSGIDLEPQSIEPEQASHAEAMVLESDEEEDDDVDLDKMDISLLDDDDQTDEQDVKMSEPSKMSPRIDIVLEHTHTSSTLAPLASSAKPVIHLMLKKRVTPALNTYILNKIYTAFQQKPTMRLKLNPPSDLKPLAYSNFKLSLEEFLPVTQFFALPIYFNKPFFEKCGGSVKDGVWFEQFVCYWESIKAKLDIGNRVGYRVNWDIAQSLAFEILKKESRSTSLVESDFDELLNELVFHHAGLAFLHPEGMTGFRSAYIKTIKKRLFYSTPRHKFTLQAFKNSCFYHQLLKLNNINAHSLFSYKHFYVLYCEFWELDSEHVLEISLQTFYRFRRHALPELVCKLIFGAKKLMGYTDFIDFLLSYQCKTTATAIEYWFRILDTDGDGLLSFHELQQFWSLHQLTPLANVADSFNDFVCVLVDLINPKNAAHFTLQDLKRNPANAETFFNMVFDLRQHDAIMRRAFDPFGRREVYGDGVNGRMLLRGWELYVEVAYERLVRDERSQEYVEDDEKIDWSERVEEWGEWDCKDVLVEVGS